MKKIFLISIVILTVISANAQNYEVLNRYMQKYGQASWNRGYQKRGEDRQNRTYEQVGHLMPAFHFNGKLNSKTLKGQFVVLDFWATWCGACRLLSCDIDSVMKRNPATYKDVQIIGVDAHEKQSAKGLKAEKWWASKGIAYPMAGGKAADACCESVQGGHPTVILVDGDGIIRGRWNGWNPRTAGLIDVAVWALKVVPEENIQADMETIKNYIDKQEYEKALYLLEMIPDAPDNSAFRYQCMLESGKIIQAEAYFTELQEKYRIRQSHYRPSEEYAAILKPIAECIYRSDSRDTRILKNGVDAFQLLANSGPVDAAAYGKEGELRIRYAAEYKKDGIQLFENALKSVKEEGNTAETERLEKLLKVYQKN